MREPPRVFTKPRCVCGDILRWRRAGLLAARWRLVCVCGRCGPWRSHPDTRVLGDAAEPGHPPADVSGSIVDIPEGARRVRVSFSREGDNGQDQ